MIPRNQSITDKTVEDKALQRFFDRKTEKINGKMLDGDKVTADYFFINSNNTLLFNRLFCFFVIMLFVVLLCL